MKSIIFAHNYSRSSNTSVGHIYPAIIDEFDRLCDTFHYGPGYPLFDKNDRIEDVIAKSSFQPDNLIFSHQWLSDLEGDTNVDPHPQLQLKHVSCSKICLLNKEYTNLENKLGYLKNNRFDLVFTHHHEAERYSEQTGIPFVFLPFGYNQRLFDLSAFPHDLLTKNIDLFFSGILQNRNFGVQSDIRRRIMRKLYFCVSDIPLAKRAIANPLVIFWNSAPPSKSTGLIAKVLQTRKLLQIEDYVFQQAQSKMSLNALSPMGLVSSRYMESMAMKSLVFAEESDLYRNIFPPNVLITFKPDLQDFYEQLLHYLTNTQDRLDIVERAYKEVTHNHSWKTRAKTITKHLE